jgi:hypothetical protein
VLINFMHLPAAPPWLLLIDTDMIFDPFGLEKLIAAATAVQKSQGAEVPPVVGGLCFAYAKGRKINPTIFKADDDGRFVNVAHDEHYTIPTDTVIDVYGTGAAFLLVHRDALVKIAELNPMSHNPWFREEEWWLPNPDHDPAAPEATPERVPYWVSEDLFFCRQAWTAGVGVYVHTGVEVEHKKSHYLHRGLYESDYSALKWQAHRAEEEKERAARQRQVVAA